MDNKVIWAVLHLQTKETLGKAAHNQETFPRKRPKLGYGKKWRVMIEALEKSWNFQSSIGNTVRDYFKDTVTPHFFNVAIRCIVLIKTAFSQAKLPSPPSSLFLHDKTA